MVVHTGSPRVLAARRAVVELLLAAHTGDCVTDPNADNCRLHRLASDHQVGAPRFRVRRPRYYPAETGNPFVIRDLSKCIMCRRCVTACNGIAGKEVLAVGYRGFSSKIVAGFDEDLASGECRDCLVCVEHCPTGALRLPAGVSKKLHAAEGK
jgi:formate dehydrogenase alpha subunit